MAAPDVVLFVVGFLLTGGAVTALVVSGGPAALGGTGGAATGIYTLEFPTTKVDVGKQAVADFTSGTLSATVTQRNVSALHVIVACTDPVPGGTFTLQIQVTTPTGVKAPAAKGGTCGSPITIDIPIATAPGKTASAGSSPEDAQNNAPHDANETAAFGAYTVKVQGARNGGQLPAGLPSAGPATTSGSITLSADVWAPKATVVPK